MRVIFLALIRFYQSFISPFISPRCRFVPSCSTYAYEAIKRYGAWRGGWLSIKRLVKCGPWHKGGFDPVPTDL